MTGSSDPASSGRMLGGRYRLTNIIARGGMAEVWVAHDTILERRVAIKILHPNLTADETLRERFRREARAAAQMTHPNIVAVFDTGVDGDAIYIVMEYVAGDTLRRVLDTGGPLPVDRALDIAGQVATALDEAHRRGLVHRDVKPANVLLDESGRAKVTDFGIAKVAGAGGDLTRTGMVVGTARYLAPEQVSGSGTDPRTDVYALALVVYEMLTGRPAFAGDTELSSAVARVTTDPASLAELRPDLDPTLVAAIERGFAREPDDRWESAARFRDALGGISTDHPTEPDAAPAPPDFHAAPSTAGAPATVAPTEAPTRSDARRATSQRPTPTADTPVVAAPRTTRPSRRRLPVVVVLALAAVVAVLAVVVLSNGVGRQGSTPIGVVGAADFDPEGDGEEHPDAVGNAVDGDPTTGWTTQTYATPDFGGLKSGVGLRVDLDGRHTVRRIEVETDQAGWSAEVYVADEAAATLGAWGPPRAAGDDLPTAARFELETGSTGRSVLLWLTRLPESGRLVVNGIDVAG